MSDLKKIRKDQLKLEFIKSAALLLLAIVLLVSVAFAWFRTIDENASVLTIALSVTSPEGDKIGIGSDVSIARNIVLPCATKLTDSTISAEDFSRAVVVEVYTVTPSVAASLSVSVTPETGSEGLHYYVCNYNDQTSTYSIAESIKIGEVTYDEEKVLSIPKGDSKIAVVYWAEYNDAFESAVNGSKKIEYKAVVNFDATEGA